MGPADPVRERLAARTAKAALVREESGKLRCLACGHRCLLAEGGQGVCRVRFVRDGELRAPWGYVASIAADPIEKKPFFHLLPGSTALSFGMLGCDLRCPYCQNWEISQTLRDPDADAWARPRPATPEGIVAAALEAGAQVVTSTYNEPLITAEWAAAVFTEARRAGLLTSFVSNGHATPEVLDFLRPLVDAYKVDLKGMRESAYREVGGRLTVVLDALAGLVARGFWVEVVTLLVPGRNDSDEELRDAARLLARLSPDLPWHVTAFHPDYRMGAVPATPAATLLRAAEIGRTEGLRYVYAGNLPGGVGDAETTACPGCSERLVERRGFRVVARRIGADGRCPRCERPIPGIWSRGGRIAPENSGAAFVAPTRFSTA
ncbi:MAG TPA: AmmeMemoRadiSam system radical SAM enzyme [Thermoanaerobaculia bacterium]|nr:AmmeMemoRadiSam system radical SAM enzyme [Thermoanaerobaculia bacterium]